ncbi:glutathione synthase [Magnetococcus marinus MC-1]|uniref:Glutathione synthetase n=1 Tax=Magnetococcus marinus (strain ATCC BAA-1437 / JCM 17883 / MC-1) TaxID=156889 RepID=A0LC81_MAGMM|nr:glutathione synthase [Magnetococcus marinus]ABK45574.1 glutathione synthase [Magnetococcus marinus MC-1]
MKIGFMVNHIQTEEVGYTTTRLAMTAVNRGHEVWYIQADDFLYASDEKVYATGYGHPKAGYKTLKNFLADIQAKKPFTQRICVSDLDVLMLRSDPSNEDLRPWARDVGIQFGRLATRHGVIVVNDPNGLSRAMNKMYLQTFPEEVRPPTIITRCKSEIRAFAKEMNSAIVVKPLQGSGGKGVFLVRSGDMSNLNQIVEGVARDGYLIAQQYMPEAAAGDTRLFVMNGLPLRYKGRYAAFRRVSSGEDLRSNLHVGGKKVRAEVTPEMLHVVEMVRPKLVKDGMFLVGLDIVGGRLMEINVFSPGGLGSAQSFEGVNFSIPVIEALERKSQYMAFYRRNFDNSEMNTL